MLQLKARSKSSQLLYQTVLFITLNCATYQVGAALIDRGGGMIYDQDLNITWLADANYAMTSGYDADGMMDIDQAYAWASSLSYGGFDDWRLSKDAYISDVYNPGELDHLFYDELGGVYGQDIALTHNDNYLLFSNIQSYTGSEYWISGSVPGDKYGDLGATYDLNTGTTGAINYWWVNDMFAWAVRDGDVYTPPPPPPPPPPEVPVPAAFWLFGSGLLGLIGIAKRKTV